ncbi:MAG: hypothetical protein QOJ89_3979 [bacterium]|jgi:hypothetical protein
MQRWSTSEPLALPIDIGSATRIDLEFAAVRRNTGTFTMYVFLNPDELPENAGRDHPSFAAGYTVFAQAGCWGDAGHCDWELGPVHEFDPRPPHHLQPINLTLDVTTAVKRLGNPDDLTVHVHAARLSDREATEVLLFERISVLVYQ